MNGLSFVFEVNQLSDPYPIGFARRFGPAAKIYGESWFRTKSGTAYPRRLLFGLSSAVIRVFDVLPTTTSKAAIVLA